VIRTLLTLMIGATLVFAAPTRSEACSFNCDKSQNNRPLEFIKRKPSNNFDTYRLRNILTLPMTDNTKIGVVILLHSCAGITMKNQYDLVRWGDFLLKNGYGILGIDHLGPRGISTNCISRSRPLGSSALLKDVYSATAFLSEQSDVDKSRIFTLGFSLGAMTGGALASRGRYEQLGNNAPRPRAVAGLYGGCFNSDRWLEAGDIPVLWLVGGKDAETLWNSCGGAVSAMKDRGLMTFHKYQNATHCWDCAGLNGFTKTAGNGNRVTYRYDPEVTKDSEQRVLNFFNSFQSQ